ncbi:MAG TPA: condensation domain-containing protein [Actinophytocola sp.]|nr:condensation domain-containing protein [Actinophytocola sp.]
MYPLTPGQFDAVFGTYGPVFINAHVLAVTLVVDEPVNRRRLAQAVFELRRRHPALRARLNEFGEAEDCRQIVDAADRDGAEVAIHEIAGEAAAGRAAELLTGGLADLARDFDIVEGRTWGVVCARIASVSYLVFAFTHFVSDLLSVMMVGREFAHLYNGYAVAGSGDDGYDTYLGEIATARRSPSRDPKVAWWLRRPWTDMSAVPGLSGDLIAEQDWTERIESIPRTARLTDLDVIAAVGRSLRDICGLTRTRIDVASHGRLSRARWSAIGCIARVVPYFVDWNTNPSPAGVTRQLGEVKAREPAWDAAFAAVRRLPTVSVDKQLGAHAFVNFHGSLDATDYVVPPFSLSPVRPSLSRPPRFPFTPFRLTVRRAGHRWVLSWRHNAFTDDELPSEVVARTTALLEQR